MFNLVPIALAVLMIVGPIVWWKQRSRAKYIEKISRLSPEQKQLEMTKLSSKMGDYKTSHVLHAVLTIFMLGIWIVPWILIAQHNASHRKKIESLMDSVIES